MSETLGIAPVDQTTTTSDTIAPHAGEVGKSAAVVEVDATPPTASEDEATTA